VEGVDVARGKPLVVVVSALFAAVCLAGPAEGSGTGGKRSASQGRRCGAPPDAPGFEIPARLHVMPDVVCMDLQLAQDKLQAAAFDNVRSEDGTPYGRRQVDDQNWVVVAQDPAAGTRGDSNTPVMLTALRYGDPGAPPVYDRSQPGRVPKLTCFDLQEAQDTLQSAGFGNVSSEDASGLDRSQIVDRNWTVVGQRPSPGPRVSKSTEIVLRVLKDDEPTRCP
jgi:beta-lactam-binding protein with PASTA domain